MHCVTLRAKLNFVLIAILFLGLAESATRVGVYSSNDCSEANLVGYTWYPYPRYPYVSAKTELSTNKFSFLSRNDLRRNFHLS
jgi:hypothetical protein